MQLDEVLPRWSFRERHSVGVAASTAAVMGAVDDVTWREVPVFRALMLARSLRGVTLDLDQPVFDGMLAGGFSVLARTDDELVFGLVRARLSIVGNFCFDGSSLTTETRVLAGDDATRRRFRLYWLVIRLPSGLIRREWLRAIAARATGPFVPPPTAGP